MTERSRQVTYRKGCAFAAYFHLSHSTWERSVRTVATPDGLLVVDYDVAGRPIGIEITAPRAVPLERLNQLPDARPRNTVGCTGLPTGSLFVVRPRAATDCLESQSLHVPPLPIAVHLNILEELTKPTRSERMDWHDATRSDRRCQPLQIGKVRMPRRMMRH